MDEKILYWNKLGLFPGPTESEEQFCHRAEYCLKLNQEISNKLPFRDEDKGTEAILAESFSQTKANYDIAPDWIPLFFSDYQLVLWHGGCAWIFQVDENSPTAAVLQLRKAFQTSPRYLGIYDRKELISHELAHVGRMTFEEPKFEEYHAYKSSVSWFRRWMGPIIQSSKESVYFVLLLLLIFILDVSIIALEKHSLYIWSMWIKAVPVLFITLGFGRLFLRHYQYNRCLAAWNQLLSDEQKAKAVVYRLTDKEIIEIGKMNQEQIKQYVSEQQNVSFRWQVIVAAYM